MPPGHDGNSEAFAFPFEWAAKVESVVATCESPQLGQAAAGVSRRTSFSNFVPQCSQTYSKIGISAGSNRKDLNLILSRFPLKYILGVVNLRACGILLLSALALVSGDAPPRSKASDFPAHIKLEDREIGAEYLVHSVPVPNGMYIAKDFLVVEVGVFPSAKTETSISSSQFMLCINDNRSCLQTRSAGEVAAALKYPDWEQQRPEVSGQAGPVIFGPRSTSGRFPGDGRESRPLPQPVPQQTGGVDREAPAPIETAIARIALPEGLTSTAVKGCLFFRPARRIKSIKSLELIYEGGDGRTTRITLL